MRRSRLHRPSITLNQKKTLGTAQHPQFIKKDLIQNLIIDSINVILSIIKKVFCFFFPQKKKGLVLNSLSCSNTIGRFPICSAAVLGLIALFCLVLPIFDGGNPARMYFDALNTPPSTRYLFGTDQMGRDIFKMLWRGGRVSLYIGLSATALSTAIALIYGTASGLAGETGDALLMRFVELLLSVPSILYVVSIQAVLGKPSAASISIVIGLTSWMNVAKMVRAEVLRIRRTEYVISAKQMGGSFFYILRRHLFPNCVPAILFMVVSNIGAAISAEATLSFMGIGLPTTVISWGSLLSLSEKALLTSSWWIILIPGFFLVTTLVCVTNLGEYYRRKNNI